MIKILCFVEDNRPVAILEDPADFKDYNNLSIDIGSGDLKVVEIPGISMERESRLQRERLFRFYIPPKILNKPAALIDYANIIEHFDPSNSNDINQRGKFTLLVWGSSVEQAEDRVRAWEKLSTLDT